MKHIDNKDSKDRGNPPPIVLNMCATIGRNYDHEYSKMFRVMEIPWGDKQIFDK